MAATVPTFASAVTTAAMASASETPHIMVKLSPVTINNKSEIDKNEQCSDSVKDINIPTNLRGSESALDRNIVVSAHCSSVS